MRKNVLLCFVLLFLSSCSYRFIVNNKSSKPITDIEITSSCTHESQQEFKETKAIIKANEKYQFKSDFSDIHEFKVKYKKDNKIITKIIKTSDSLGVSTHTLNVFDD